MKKLLIATAAIININAIMAQEDKYQWLEEVDSKKSLEFVENLNKSTENVLTTQPKYQDVYNKVLTILNSNERIIYPSIEGDYIYNFWQDKDHTRGIWRRISKTDYNANKNTWETLLDIDQLSNQDNAKWVYHGAEGLYPNYNKFLVELSNGGGDAVTIKEFDVTTKKFIENGFYVPDAKSNISYVDENTVLIGTDFGIGSMTTSGYPRVVKLWKRGTPLSSAETIFEGKETDVSNSGYVMRDGDKKYIFVNNSDTFFTGKNYVYLNKKLIKIDIPDDSNIIGLLNNQLMVNLKSDWKVVNKTYTQGSVISLDFTALLTKKHNIKNIYIPNAQSSFDGATITKNYFIYGILNNVKNELYKANFVKGKWNISKINAPDFGTIGIIASDEKNDDFYFNFQNFLEPTTLYFANAKSNIIKKVKSLPSFFPSDKYKVEQFKAKSKDGEMIPYFVVSAKNMPLNGENKTLLNAYGGFEVSMQPTYSAAIGQGWLENGGVYVLANIRGGGEFGPKWHQAGLKEKRQNIYNDFAAVAEDLTTKKITNPKKLGIMGGSNGGLLMGVAFTQRPDLYNAVVCQVPLLDMQRYSKLLAGASWIGEYGDPDKPEEWEYIKKYSPYQNLKEGTKYPEVFFMTSTRDDRVHPGHARKMAAKMIDMGNKIYYYENTEGGHGASSTNEQRAKFYALMYSYLLMKLD